MRRFTWLAALLLLPAASARADQWDKTYPVTGRPTLHAETKDGSVRIESWDQKAVSVTVLTRRWHIGPRGVQIEQRQDGNRIEVRVIQPHPWISFGFDIPGIRVEIRVPREADLDVTTGDGRVDVTSVAGHLVIASGDGSVTADDVHGELSLTSGDGAIVATHFDGRLKARTGDGRLRIDGRFDALDLSTGDGSVSATARAGSRVAEDWNLETGDGPVSLYLPASLDADLDARTNDGRIDLDLPVTMSGSMRQHEIRGRINHGGATLRIRTGDGSIRIGPEK